MDRLCFATFAKLLQSALLEPNGNEFIVRLLLEPIIEAGHVMNRNKERLQITSKLVSILLNRHSNVQKVLKEATTKPKVLEAIKDCCQNEIIPVLNPYGKEDYLEGLAQLIQKDDSISEPTRMAFLDPNIALDERLAQIFVYAIHATNKLPSHETLTLVKPLPPKPPVQKEEPSSLYLLMEANGTCPICGVLLVTVKNGYPLEQYEVVSLYPSVIHSKDSKAWKKTQKPCEDLSSSLNHTVLCLKCAKDYGTHTTVADYESLLCKKQALFRNYQAKEQIASLMLEEEIELVLRSITTAPQDRLQEPLSYNALRLCNKIAPQNSLLIIKTQGFVDYYYHYISSMLSDLEYEGILSCEMLSLEVKLAYRKLAKQNLNQNEIFTWLTNWFKLKCPSADPLACEVIVAFFIQSCEVFDEIS